jgi:hypothetical protein
MVNNEELIGTTEYLTLQTRCRIKCGRYNRVRLYILTQQATPISTVIRLGLDEPSLISVRGTGPILLYSIHTAWLLTTHVYRIISSDFPHFKTSLWSPAFLCLTLVPSSATCSSRLVRIQGKLHFYYVLHVRGSLVFVFGLAPNASFVLLYLFLRIVLVSQASRPVLGLTQPPIQWVRGLSPRVKRPEGAAGHSPKAIVGG